MELLPAYSIGALDNDEQNAVDEYFAQQETIRLRLIDLEQATTLLAQEADDAEMAADARDRLMARVLADSPDAAQVLDTEGVDAEVRPVEQGANGVEKSTALPSAGRAEHDTAAQDTNVPQGAKSANVPRTLPKTHLPASQSQAATRHAAKPHRRVDGPESSSASFWQSLFGVVNGRALVNAGLAASVAAVLLLAALAGGLDRQVRALQSTQRADQQVLVQASERLSMLEEENRSLVAAQDAAESDLSELRIIFDETDAERSALYAEYQRLRGELAANNERITLVGAASQATVMFGTDEAPGLQGTFFHRGEEGALVVHGLEPLPTDQTYQFWLVTENGDQVSAGLFLVDEDAEPTWASLALPQDAPEYVVVGVSIEPATGSPVPTGPMLLESPADQGISF